LFYLPKRIISVNWIRFGALHVFLPCPRERFGILFERPLTTLIERLLPSVFVLAHIEHSMPRFLDCQVFQQPSGPDMEIRICVRLSFSKLVGSQHYEPLHINAKEEAQIQ